MPDHSITTCSIPELPGNWREAPAPVHTQNLGTRLLKAGKKLLIRIPSAIVPQECDYLINPLHPLIAETQIIAEQDFIFDTRIKSLAQSNVRGERSQTFI